MSADLERRMIGFLFVSIVPSTTSSGICRGKSIVTSLEQDPKKARTANNMSDFDDII